MNIPATNLPDAIQRCVTFHGHLCPGVIIGYHAATLGMELLQAGRSEDEEFITIVENDTCAVDAIQVLTGCTFGKGNLYFHDYGKMVFTFASRSDGRSVRLYHPPTDLPILETFPESERRERRIEHMIAMDPSELFDVQHNVLTHLPARARIYENCVCDYCGEVLMKTRVQQCHDRCVCIPCQEKYLKEL
jgi:formylmethanofuran dehydrogenase subunit E